MATKKITKQVRNARLTKLALFLLALPEGKFDYGVWGQAKSKEKLVKLAPNACGTTACALGWATAIKPFRAKGLRMKLYHTMDDAAYGDVYCGRSSGTRAAEKFFGLTSTEATYLFIPEDNNEVPESATAREVAHHILDFVAKGMPEGVAEPG